MSKIGAALAYLRARLDERSTYMLIIGSIGAVAGLPKPFNWIGFVVLIIAAFTPDGPVK
jgi:hypothetical protein